MATLDDDLTYARESLAHFERRLEQYFHAWLQDRLVPAQTELDQLKADIARWQERVRELEAALAEQCSDGRGRHS